MLKSTAVLTERIAGAHEAYARARELRETGKYTKVLVRREKYSFNKLIVSAYQMVEETGHQSGECQICGRMLKVIDGRLSLHGYQRPGWGYVVGRCYGAKYPTYQESKKRLVMFVEMLKDQLVHAEETTAKMRVVTEISVEYGVYKGAGKQEKKWWTVREGEKFERPADCRLSYYSFEDVRDSRVRECMNKEREAREMLAHFTDRLRHSPVNHDD